MRLSTEATWRRVASPSANDHGASKTPSGASDCLTGCNEWLEWRRADGRTLQALERDTVAGMGNA